MKGKDKHCPEISPEKSLKNEERYEMLEKSKRVSSQRRGCPYCTAICIDTLFVNCSSSNNKINETNKYNGCTVREKERERRGLYRDVCGGGHEGRMARLPLGLRQSVCLADLQ